MHRSSCRLLPVKIHGGNELHSFNVCRSPVERWHILRPFPPDFLMFGQMWCARFEMADECSELHGAEIVTLDGCAYLIGDGDFAQQFFFDFTTQRLTTALPRLDLTAGEFPIAGEGFLAATASAQYLAVAYDGRRRPRRSVCLCPCRLFRSLPPRIRPFAQTTTRNRSRIQRNLTFSTRLTRKKYDPHQVFCKYHSFRKRNKHGA